MTHNSVTFGKRESNENANRLIAIAATLPNPTRESQAFVAQWQARFQFARNKTCEGQKNFRGIGY